MAEIRGIWRNMTTEVPDPTPTFLELDGNWKYCKYCYEFTLHKDGLCIHCKNFS